MDPYVRKFFEMNNMRNGYVFMQGFYDDGRLYVHEMGYRLNGGVAYKIVEHFSGFNQIEQLIRFTLTGRMEDKEVGKNNPHFDGYGLILATTLNNGTIGKVSGLDKVGRIDGVLDCSIILRVTVSMDWARPPMTMRISLWLHHLWTNWLE